MPRHRDRPRGPGGWPRAEPPARFAHRLVGLVLALLAYDGITTNEIDYWYRLSNPDSYSSPIYI